jgi:hypothetical protein
LLQEPPEQLFEEEEGMYSLPSPPEALKLTGAKILAMLKLPHFSHFISVSLLSLHPLVTTSQTFSQSLHL